MTGHLPKVVHRGLVVGMITAVLAVSMAQAASPEMQSVSNAATDSRTAQEPPPRLLGPLSAPEEEGYGCLVAGGAALALTAAVGAPDTLLLFTGGASVIAIRDLLNRPIRGDLIEPPQNRLILLP